MKTKFLIALFILISVTSGCINYTEETWLKDDLSGRMSFKMELAEELYAMASQGQQPFDSKEFGKMFEVKGIKLTEYKTYTEAGNQVLAVDFTFLSLEALKNIKANNDGFAFIGKVSATKNKKGQLVFTRIISNNQDASEVNSFTASLFSKGKFKITVHFPFKIISANTSDKLIDLKNNTVTWEFSFLSTMLKPQEMTAVLEPFNPLPWMAGGIVVILGIGAWCFYLFILKTEKQEG